MWLIQMLIDEAKRRQGELIQILKEMASSYMDDDAIRTVVIKFKSLYSNGFRHDYSEFFPLIVEFSKDDNEYNLDYLSNNLQTARSLVEQDFVADEKEFKGLYKPLLKLSNHLNLEIGRYSYYSISEQQVKDLQTRNHKLQSELRDTTAKLEEATMQLNEAGKKVSSVQTELISVLSIFAAIVLTFSGSMSLLGNAFTGMQGTRFFKAAFFVLLCGFILCNTIFLMMYLVGKITGRNIYANCKSKDCTCGKDGSPKCCSITRVRKRLPYVFWLNLAFILLMVADVIVWYFDNLCNIIP